MPDGTNMMSTPEFSLQAAHLLISELMGARLDLTTRLLMTEERLKAAELRISELEAAAAAVRKGDEAPQ